MKIKSLLLVMSLTGLAGFCGEDLKPALSSEDLKQLVEQLGSEEFQKREQAAKKLGDLGRKALSILEKAKKSKNAQIRTSATELFNQIRKKYSVPLVLRTVDPDGDALTFTWRQISGPKANIQDPSSSKTYFIPPNPGKYIFEIEVSDGQASTKATVTRIVRNRKIVR